jgi:hypothetical protein
MEDSQNKEVEINPEISHLITKELFNGFFSFG